MAELKPDIKPIIVKPDIVKPDIVKPDIVKPIIVKPQDIIKPKRNTLGELYESFSEILDFSSEEIMPSLALLSVGSIVLLALAVLSQNMVMLYMLRIRGPY